MRVSEAVLKMGGLTEKDMGQKIRAYEKQSDEEGEEEIPYYRCLTPFHDG